MNMDRLEASGRRRGGKERGRKSGKRGGKKDGGLSLADDGAFKRIRYKRATEKEQSVVFPSLLPQKEASFNNLDSAWMVGFVEQEVREKLERGDVGNEYEVRLAAAPTVIVDNRPCAFLRK